MKANQGKSNTFFVSLWCLTFLTIIPVQAVLAVIPDAKQIPSGRVGSSYNLVLPAKGGVPPYKWTTIGGTLPPGLTLSTNGVLSGKFEKEGDYAFTVQVTDSRGEKTSKQVKIRVEPMLTGIAPLKIKTDALPSAVEGKPYQLALAAEGGISPYEWEIEGTLPKGLELDNKTGKITGTPEESGASKVTLKVSDAQGNSMVAAQAIDFTVTAFGKPKKWYQKWWVVVLATIGIILIILVFITYFLTRQCPNPTCKSFRTKHIGGGHRRCSVCGTEFWPETRYQPGTSG